MRARGRAKAGELQGVHEILCFSLNFMIFLNSASSAAAPVFYLPGVCTHTLSPRENRERPESGIIFKNRKNTIFIEHPVALPSLLISLFSRLITLSFRSVWKVAHIGSYCSLEHLCIFHAHGCDSIGCQHFRMQSISITILIPSSAAYDLRIIKFCVFRGMHDNIDPFFSCTLSYGLHPLISNFIFVFI